MQKLTTLDFPGVVSALIFTQGCNYHCPYCHNAQLIPRKPAADAISRETVLAFLKKRADLLDGVVITGGEPCLQPGLMAFCREIKTLGYKVKLDTNGAFPRVVERLLDEKLLDYAAVDVKADPAGYAPRIASEKKTGESLAATLSLLAARGLPHEARTTCVAPFVDRPGVNAMAEIIGREVPWFFQRARLEKNTQDMRALADEEILALVASLQKTHPLARLRE